MARHTHAPRNWAVDTADPQDTLHRLQQSAEREEASHQVWGLTCSRCGRGYRVVEADLLNASCSALCPSCRPQNTYWSNRPDTIGVSAHRRK